MPSRPALALGALCFLLLAFAGLALSASIRKLHHAQTALLRTQTENAAAQARVAGMERDIAQLKSRLSAAEEDNATLLSTVDELLMLKSGSVQPGARRYAKQEIESRYHNAQDLARAGQNDEALAEYLWCLDEGMVSLEYFGWRSDLLQEIAKLGQNHPPALAALQMRREKLETALAQDPNDTEALVYFVSFNHAVGDTAKNLALFESIPSGDSRRRAFGNLFETFVSEKRYADAADVMPYQHALLQLIGAEMVDGQGGTAESKARFLRTARENAGGYLEVLLGSGKVDAAREYAAKVLKFNDTAVTRQLLHSAATRAGRPDFVVP